MQKYWLLASWWIIMVGIWWVWRFLWFEPNILLHGLRATNLVILMGSLLYRYKDGIVVFQIAYWLITLIIWWRVYFNADVDILWKAVRIHIAANAAIYAFMYFVWGLVTSIPHYFREILGVLTHSTIIILLLQTSTNIYHGLFIAQVYITLIYTFFYYVLQQPETIKVTKGVTLDEILEWKRILGKQIHTTFKDMKPTWIANIQKEIAHVSSYTKASLSILNIVVILAMMLWFFFHIQEGVNILIRELLYRLSIWLFVVNFILIKKIDFYYKIQRIFVFFIINFAIYLSLLNISHLLNRDATSITLIATLWNIVNSIAIFYSQDVLKITSIKIADYYYRIAANLLAMIINIVLIARLLEVPWQLRFALVTIYVGVQGYLMYYNIQYIKNLDNNQDTKPKLFTEDPDKHYEENII
jgi:hypothetical protein